MSRATSYSFCAVLCLLLASCKGDDGPRRLLEPVQPQSPVITQQPASLTVKAPATATFTVAATGQPLPAYQWLKDGVDLEGRTEATLAIPETIASDAGTYRVRVTNTAGSVLSQEAVLKVDPPDPGPPRILVQPADVSAVAPAPVRLTVRAIGNPEPTYQWTKDGRDLPGETRAVLLIDPSSASHTGTYRARVANVHGSLESAAALVTVRIGEFVQVGSLQEPRQEHTATLLGDGSVLVAGGAWNGLALQTAERFDPVAATFRSTGSMQLARFGHTATLLADGRVLVAGGTGPFGPVIGCEIYDPATGRFTPGGNLATARWGHAALRLDSGKILLLGGQGAFGMLTSAELYDPATGTSSLRGNLSQARMFHACAPVAGSRILVAGGTGPSGPLDSLELYDPSAGTTQLLSGRMSSGRTRLTATLLASGDVLLAGGQSSGGGFLAKTDLYRASTQGLAALGDMASPRAGHSAVRLPGGEVLVAGGTSIYVGAELWSPVRQAFSPVPGPSLAFSLHAAVALKNGTVLLCGGATPAGTISDAWLYR